MSESKFPFFPAAAILFLALASGCATQSGPPAPRVLDATDPAAISSAMPTVSVAGTVSNTRDNNGVLTIDFKGAEKSRFYAVILSGNRDALDAAFGGNTAKAISGKPIHVIGQVVLYRGRPEIVISKPAQLVIDPQS